TSPEDQVLYFLKSVIDNTSDLAAAYKPNLAFFEALGSQGLQVFKEIIDYIPDGKIVIADGKRGDIHSTAEHYARAYFENFDVDALTLNPLMGFETLEPFLNFPNKAVFVLTLTSNAGSKDFLSKPIENDASVASYIARNLADFDKKFRSHIGMVVGATKPQKITSVIQHHSRAALLIPGIGAQGGSIEQLRDSLKNHKGISLVNSSRSIIYAGQNKADWKKAVAQKAQQYKEALKPINKPYA
ncbi:MAG TPA: orotidine-5'-phosphate decarboxylase, partial [Balneolaceae bacterium]|nr:orotidine-5'-phosphate decarboxylase [Balneolaceae bacterium]